MQLYANLIQILIIGFYATILWHQICVLYCILFAWCWYLHNSLPSSWLVFILSSFYLIFSGQQLWVWCRALWMFNAHLEWSCGVTLHHVRVWITVYAVSLMKYEPHLFFQLRVCVCVCVINSGFRTFPCPTPSDPLCMDRFPDVKWFIMIGYMSCNLPEAQRAIKRRVVGL